MNRTQLIDKLWNVAYILRSDIYTPEQKELALNKSLKLMELDYDQPKSNKARKV